MAKQESPTPFITPSELTRDIALATEFTLLKDFIDEYSATGAPYRVRQLLNDRPELRSLQTPPGELKSQAGTITTISENRAKGERVWVIGYDPNGVVLANAKNSYLGANVVSVLSAEKRSDKSLFTVSFNMLDSDKTVIEGKCWLANPRLHVRSKALYEFATKWGLEAAWEDYLAKGMVGNEAMFTGIMSSTVVNKTLLTLQRMTEPGF